MGGRSAHAVSICWKRNEATAESTAYIDHLFRPTAAYNISSLRSTKQTVETTTTSECADYILDQLVFCRLPARQYLNT